MPIWKITPKGPTKVAEGHLKLEEHLEDWIANDPSLLGEPLLIVGRQVLIPDVKDRLDLLALDPRGNAVIIELKRGKLRDPVDMQALRYASYVSKWSYEDFERVASGYLGKGDPDFNFNAAFENFCNEAGVDEVPDLNRDQRLLVVGSEVEDRLGSVGLWLRDHGVDIKMMTIEVYSEGGMLFVRPQTIIPLPLPGEPRIGRTAEPWRVDGRAWHLEKRCSPKTSGMLLKLHNLIEDHFEGVKPKWAQKEYVAYEVGSHCWLYVNTAPTVLLLTLRVKADAFKEAELARRLGVEEFHKAQSRAEKLGLSNSVSVENLNASTDRVMLRIKEDFDLGSKEFLRFLKEAHDAWPRH
jgi:hypothetical protein